MTGSLILTLFLSFLFINLSIFKSVRPIQGNFFGVPLIANIIGNSYPEIICRENNDITIISYLGERLKMISSYDSSQQLTLIPDWEQDKIGLVDGYRILSFSQDIEHSYWMNKYSRPSNYPLVTL